MLKFKFAEFNFTLFLLLKKTINTHKPGPLLDIWIWGSRLRIPASRRPSILEMMTLFSVFTFEVNRVINPFFNSQSWRRFFKAAPIQTIIYTQLTSKKTHVFFYTSSEMFWKIGKNCVERFHANIIIKSSYMCVS